MVPVGLDVLYRLNLCVTLYPVDMFVLKSMTGGLQFDAAPVGRI